MLGLQRLAVTEVLRGLPVGMTLRLGIVEVLDSPDFVNFPPEGTLTL